MATNYETFEYDVLVIGAGGAGLRAAIEASAAGVTVGLICKSLLGKAHTVMAEGGMAAAMGNVDDRDNWKVHFADTMRGGQYVNNWRMAELHAKEAPARVHELEAWGAVFDRTKEGKISQRNFGGHRYPAPGPCRRPHRSRNDPHAAGPRHSSGHHGPHGMDHRRAAQGRQSHRRRVRLRSRAGPLQGFQFKAKAVVVASGGLGRAFKITSNSWEGTGDGHSLAYHAGAELLDMNHPVPPDGHDLAAECAGDFGHGKCPR